MPDPTHTPAPAPAPLPPARPRPGRWWTLATIWSSIFLLAASLVWSLGLNRGRGQYDQINYHLPVIRQFLSQWPDVDLSDYQSATTPGYHLVLAFTSRMFNFQGELPLRILASGFTIAMLALLAAMMHRRSRDSGIATPTLALLGLPVVCSMYVFTPGVWLQPDNAGWLGVLAMIALTWQAHAAHGWRLIAQALVLALLVLVRQSHAWTGVLVLASSSIHAASTANVPTTSRVPYLRPILSSGLVGVPALLLLVYFLRLWHGLTPPSFASQHAGGNLAAPAFTLALFAVYSLFFIAWFLPDLLRIAKHRWYLLYFAATIGIILAVVPETTFLREPRSSGLWNLVGAMDARGLTLFGRTSPLILLLAPLGAVAVVGWLATLSRPRALYALALLAGFTLAQSANANAWQRYFEPMLLMGIALLAAGVKPAASRLLNILSQLGPLALSLLLAALTFHSLTRTEAFPVPTNPKAIVEQRDQVSAPRVPTQLPTRPLPLPLPPSIPTLANPTRP